MTMHQNPLRELSKPRSTSPHPQQVWFVGGGRWRTSLNFPDISKPGEPAQSKVAIFSNLAFRNIIFAFRNCSSSAGLLNPFGDRNSSICLMKHFNLHPPKSSSVPIFFQGLNSFEATFFVPFSFPLHLFSCYVPALCMMFF